MVSVGGVLAAVGYRHGDVILGDGHIDICIGDARTCSWQVQIDLDTVTVSAILTLPNRQRPFLKLENCGVQSSRLR